MRSRRTKITFPVFNGVSVHVLFSGDLKATGRRLRVDLSGAMAAYVPAGADDTGPAAKRSYIVFGLDPDEATVAHEASHAIRALMKFVGAKVDDENFAYHLDYLVGRIHKFMRKG